MRRIGNLAVKIATVAALLSLFGTGLVGAEVAQPVIEATPKSVDLGRIDEGVQAKAVFTIKNIGNAELVIYDVHPTCGCTVANLSAKKLAPGETATLEAVYNSHYASGVINKFINVQTNDPKNSVFVLGITANVIAKPAPEINFSIYNETNMQLASGGTTTRSITVTNTGQIDLVISELTTSQGATASIGALNAPSGQTTKLSLTLKPGESKKLDITISPRIKSGNFQEIVTVRSNAKMRPAATFIAQGMVQG